MLTIFLVLSAIVYVGMMIHVLVRLYRNTLPERVVLWVPHSFVVFAMSVSMLLSEHTYMGWLETLTIISAALAAVAALEIWFLLRLEYARKVDILDYNHTTRSYLMWVSFGGCVSMLVCVASLFVFH